MPNFYSPTGNFEVWETKPGRYLTESEWASAHPARAQVEPSPEELKQARIADILAQLDELDRTYLTPCTLVDFANAVPFAIDRVVKHDELATPLRAQLAAEQA
ncbi:MAG: hypothetical protein LBT40_04825 [Deltaproteobacteria bacterium]|jgi:hypothetical protein|nr:hypothetical protein [Deltaproteobacteria bacterium]